jgi:hypothetical protein
MEQETLSPIIRTLWHGSQLTVYEAVSLQSFLAYGHAVELYAYSEMDVPNGVTLCDAGSVLPLSSVFSYSDGPQKGSFAAFSNLFRYRLLLEKGGIWADLDFLCLRQLHELPIACVGRMIWERKELINVGLMRFPPGHALCERLYEQALKLGAGIAIGEASNALIARLLSERNDWGCEILPVSALYPIHWHETWKMFDPDERPYCEEKSATSHCVHWWNTALRYLLPSKEAFAPKGSFLFEKARQVSIDLSRVPTWSSGELRTSTQAFRALMTKQA